MIRPATRFGTVTCEGLATSPAQPHNRSRFHSPISPGSYDQPEIDRRLCCRDGHVVRACAIQGRARARQAQRLTPGSSTAFRKTNPPWTWFVPLLAWLVMAAAIMLPGAFMFGLAAIGLIGVGLRA